MERSYAFFSCKTSISQISDQPSPSYLFGSCFIPKSVLNELDKMVRTLYGEGEGKIHLINWNSSCQPIERGGLGLRAADDYYQAMLGKQ